MAYELKHKTNRQISNGIFYPLGAALSLDSYTVNPRSTVVLVSKQGKR